MQITSINQLRSTVSTRTASPAPASPEAQPAAPGESSQLGSVPARIAAVSAEALAAVQKDIGQGEYVEGEVLVKLKPGQLSLANSFASEYGANVIETFDIPSDIYKTFNGDLLRLKLPAGISTAEAIAAMKDDKRVAYAESNDILDFIDGEGQEPPDSGEPPTEPPRDPWNPNDLHENLWGFRNTGQTGGTSGADASIVDAWKVTTGDASENGPLIAIIDSGADMDHPDLVGNFWTNPGEIPGDGIDNDENGVIDDVHGYDAGNDDGDPDDQVGHGTHVAGTIGAVGNNGEGVTGVNQQARLMPIRIDAGGRITTDGVVRGMMYAARMGADITNNSWGGGRLNQAIEDAFRACPALHICAAGNNGADTDDRPFYPMGFDMPNIVAVGATDHNDRKASFSNYGATSVDVAAPGKDIYSTKNGGGYHSLSGTSMASPFVTGVAGLIKSAYPEASHQQIKERLIYGSDSVDELASRSVSNGRVNAANSLENDQSIPGAPNDFWIQDTSSRGTTIRWTSTGDDNWSGQSAATELRVSTEPITEENFGEVSAMSAPAPGPTGHLETVPFQLQPSTEPRTFHFAMKVVDNVGNRSEMRTTSVTIPAAQTAYANDFDAEESVWSGDGSWARVEAEGRGKVWTDSPDGNMSDETTTSLTSGAISLKETSGNLLTFDAKHQVGWSDSVTVQVAPVPAEGEEETWTTVATPAGRSNRSSDWAQHSVDLSAFDGQDVRLRFVVEGGRSASRYDGFYLDNLSILGDPA